MDDRLSEGRTGRKARGSRRRYYLHMPWAVSRIELYTAFEQVPDEAARSAFRDLVRRRAEGTPVAYLVGQREFYSLSFRVTPDVLIPRPETELLVVTAIDLAKNYAATADCAAGKDGRGVLNIATWDRQRSNCRLPGQAFARQPHYGRRHERRRPGRSSPERPAARCWPTGSSSSKAT